MVNELLTNAFKHASEHAAHGVITIECLRQDDAAYRVVVGDDGLGLPSGIQWPVPGKDRFAYCPISS